MTINSKRWTNTLPHRNINLSAEAHNINASKWIENINTNKWETNTHINTNKWETNTQRIGGNRPFVRYLLASGLFILGLIVVSVVKNETRNLEKEISNLQQSIYDYNFNLHQATLDHEVITSPENISKLAKEYLESNFVFYKKNQIKKINNDEKIFSKLQKTKHEKKNSGKIKNLPDEVKLKVQIEIDKKKMELAKLKKIYSEPEKLPDEVKIRIAKKMENTKDELKNLYNDPEGIIGSEKVHRWAVMQVVKVFLGIPIVPGK